MTTTQTTTQTTDRAVSMFGMTTAEIRAMVADSMLESPRMVAMSELSNAQEMIERGQSERARQALNRAKWIMSEYWQGEQR